MKETKYKKELVEFDVEKAYKTEEVIEMLKKQPKRKFVESVDISFTIKDVDLKNPNNRIKEEVRLPSGRGKELKITLR